MWSGCGPGGLRCAGASVQRSSHLLRQAYAAIIEIGPHQWIVCVVLQALRHRLIVRLQRCVVVRARSTMAGQIAIQIGVTGGNSRDNGLLGRRGGRRCRVLTDGVATPSHQHPGGEASPPARVRKTKDTCRISRFHGCYFLSSN